MNAELAKRLCPCLILMFSSIFSHATHIRAAELAYRSISDQFYIYEFTLTGYADTGSPVRFGDGIIDFGDGQSANLGDEANSYHYELLGENNETERYLIKIIHTYVASGQYTVSYHEPNRNDEIVNINKGNSVQTPFHLEASLVIDPLIGPNSSPILNSFAIDRGFTGKIFSHNPWAWDTEGDSLVYRLLTPLQDQGQEVPNFELPDDPDFYIPPFNYNSGNEDGSGPAVFEIDPLTGDLWWDAPGNLFQNSQGEYSEYNVAFLVEEWRKVEGTWRRIGHITRDMQIIITGQEISRPDFQIPGETLLFESETVQETITFKDPGGDPIKVEFFGEVFELTSNPMTINTVPEDFVSGPLALTFEWTPLPEHARDRPYFVHLKITDDPADPEVRPAVTYKTWILSFSELPDVITSLPGEQEETEFLLYPNPTTDWLAWRLERNDREIRNLTIYNSLGQQTFSAELTSYGVREIDISRFPSGWYLVELATDTKLYRKPFIKK